MKTAALLLLLATAFPAEPVPVVDAPGVASAPAGATFDLSAIAVAHPVLAAVLPVLGLFLMSLVASFWSEHVRRLGPKAAPWMLSLSAALNRAAGNPHKGARAARAAKAAKGGES
jgi:hypothetical protein